MPPSEAQRRAILADLNCPIMGSGLDHEIADDHGVTPADVRRLRGELRRDEGVAEILALGRELAQLNDSALSPGEMVELVMHETVARARKRAESKGGTAARPHTGASRAAPDERRGLRHTVQVAPVSGREKSVSTAPVKRGPRGAREPMGSRNPAVGSRGEERGPAPRGDSVPG